MSAVLEPFRELVRRRLWPVAVLLLVAAVAAPKLLADPAVPAVVSAGTAVQDDGPFSSRAITTVAAADGTERRRVLGALKDPFKPTGKQPKRTSSSSSASPSASSSSPSSSSSSSSSSGSSSGSGSSGGGLDDVSVPGLVGVDTTSGTTTPPSTGDTTTSAPKTTVPRYALRIAFDEEKRTLERLDPLPDADKPAIIYLGLLQDGKTAVFLLDASVTAEGDGSCHPSPTDCQRLYLEKGETAFFEVAGSDGSAGEQHQLDLLSINTKASASKAKAPKATKARAAVAAAGRRALRARMARVGRLRFDARTGRLRELSAAEWRRARARAASR
jgi:hypothetical protein